MCTMGLESVWFRSHWALMRISGPSHPKAKFVSFFRLSLAVINHMCVNIPMPFCCLQPAEDFLRNWRRQIRWDVLLYWSSKYQFPLTVSSLVFISNTSKFVFLHLLFSLHSPRDFFLIVDRSERRARKQNQIHSASSYSRNSFIFCHHLSFSQHLSVRIFIIQPITVFKLKANENNPHDLRLSTLLFTRFSLSLFNWILVSYKIHLAGDFKMTVQTASWCWGVKWPILRWIEWKMLIFCESCSFQSWKKDIKFSNV